jgi:hypoxanthine phosphoribosyltransferase
MLKFNPNIGYEPLIEETLITAPQLQNRIGELGQQISNAYAGKELILICILRGAIMFLSDISRAIHVPHMIDFMAVSSYGAGARTSSGQPRISHDVNLDIHNRHTLVIEDIVDSGHTMSHVLRFLGTREPASLKVCSLLTKPTRREVEIKIDYVGFEIPDKFVFGYGLDLDEYFRNLPFVGVLKKEYY